MNRCAPKVLVVDDDRYLTEAMSLRLRAHGYIVKVFHSAILAAEVVLNERPSVILLDVEMAHFTGLEFHQCLRLTERGRCIPVIYVTGQPSERIRIAAMELGAAGFFQKPFDSNQLIATLERVRLRHVGRESAEIS